MNSIMETAKKINDSIKKGYIELTGQSKRILLGILSKEAGKGGQNQIAKEFKVSRMTIRKGIREFESGEITEDAFHMRGRKKAVEILPTLETQIKAIVDSQSQIDPKFQSERIYTKITGKEIKKQLIQRGNFKEEELPCERTIRNITNRLGYTLRKVRKTKPKKKLPETDAIFETLKIEHERVTEDETAVRLSIDTKDRVKIGTFSRGGRSRAKVAAMDHDFGDEYIVPFGILDVKESKVALSMSETKVTADFMVDQIEEYWIRAGYDKTKKTLLLNSDNGTENNSHRTQFIKRLIEFSIEYNVEVRLAYYPPYHSKYNPIERVWGFLEEHWNGALIDSADTLIKYAKSLKYKQCSPEVTLVKKVYETGNKVSKDTMLLYESALKRMDGLEKYFVTINPSKCIECLALFELYG